MATQEQRSVSCAVIGGGKMGEAIVSGWLAATVAPADAIRAEHLVVVEPTEERRAFLTGALDGRDDRWQHVTCIADVSQLQATPDLVVLAVKPQVMHQVLESVRAQQVLQGGQGGPLFVSIAAGLDTATIEAGLPENAPLVRVMPNLPLSVGEGASGVCGGSVASDEQVRTVADLFGCLGKAVVVDEADMDTVCAVSGSGPAYVAAMIESLRDAAAAHGLDADLAETLALQTVLGTARFIGQSGLTVAQAREAVCSPGGTTLAALDAMNEAGFDDVFKAGVDAAIKRAKELAECS